MVGGWIGSMPGSLAVVARRGRWWRFSWNVVAAPRVRQPAHNVEADDVARRLHTFRYHLGRGRRAREAGQFEKGVAEARRALALNPSDPWALALLGQCLQRQHVADLAGARRALERAWALEPTNGYFVRLLLDVLHAQGDSGACIDLLTWAWWRGAPVERWLPDGPPIPVRSHERDDPRRVERPVRPLPTSRQGRSGSRALLASRQPAHAWGT